MKIDENTYIVMIPFVSYPCQIIAINLSYEEACKVKPYINSHDHYNAAIINSKELKNYDYEYNLYGETKLCDILNN